jgi:4-diphosphocytidyl-2-C-methyl-D-erythritol kinase
LIFNGGWRFELQPPSVFKPEITLVSFAKINLSLRILGKRRDGYHEVVTVLQTVSLHDELHILGREDDRLVLSCSSVDVPTDETNLIIRAARLLSDKYDLRRGADFHLEKKIPPGGGLGGASSNAAVALLGLARLWELDLSLSQLVEIASQLGADVPFFFIGGRAVGTGTGTEVRPFPDSPALDLLIVTPAGKVSTAEAYSALKATALTTANSVFILPSSHAEEFLTNLRQWRLQNDFESVIFETEPEVERVQKALLGTEARGVLLAGSGSSVFGIFDSVEAQQRALQKIKAETGWRIFPCRTLSRREYVQALGSCGVTLLRSNITRFDSGA